MGNSCSNWNKAGGEIDCGMCLSRLDGGSPLCNWLNLGIPSPKSFEQKENISRAEFMLVGSWDTGQNICADLGELMCFLLRALLG
jgi:hypothetical protein